VDRRGVIAYLLILQTLLLSAILHAPWSEPSLYTDIIGAYWRDFAAAGRIPYLHREPSGDPFEYPYIAAAISLLCSSFGGGLTGFYVAYSLTVMAFGVLLAYCALKFKNGPLTLICLAAPSLIVYGIYGYDVIMAALTALAILLYIGRRYTLSGIVLALSAHVKFYSVIFLPYALIDLKGRDRLRFLAAFAITYLAPVAALPSAFIDLVKFHSSWGIEAAWYIFLFPDAAHPVMRLTNIPPDMMASIRAAQVFGYAIFILLYLHVLGLKTSPEKFMALSLMAYFMGTPRYSPQSNILFLPFLASVIDVRAAPFFILWEAANASVIMTWFASSAPHLPWQPPQIAALIRFIGLAMMFVSAETMLGAIRIRIPKKVRKGIDVFGRVIGRIVGRL